MLHDGCVQFHKLRKSCATVPACVAPVACPGTHLTQPLCACDAHRFPRLFCSRLGNKVWYSQVGGLEIVRNTCRTMWQNTHLVCDGVHVPLPPGTQGIIVLNIGSYGGGADLWGPSDDDSVASRVARSPHGATTPVLGTAPSRTAGSAAAASGSAAAGAAVTSVGAERLPITDDFVVPSPHDGLLEIVAVTGSLHLAQTQGMLGHALCTAARARTAPPHLTSTCTPACALSRSRAGQRAPVDPMPLVHCQDLRASADAGARGGSCRG